MLRVAMGSSTGSCIFEHCYPEKALCIKDFCLADLFYQLSVLFRVHATTIMEVCETEDYDPEEEFQKLRAALKETMELYK